MGAVTHDVQGAKLIIAVMISSFISRCVFLQRKQNCATPSVSVKIVYERQTHCGGPEGGTDGGRKGGEGKEDLNISDGSR